VQAPDARWLVIAGTLALACTPVPTRVEPRGETSVPGRPHALAAPPEPAPAPAVVTPRPGELTRLHIGEGWGCVVDVTGALWCWGHGPVPAPPWQAVRVDTPGPVLALASDRESASPAHHVTCATFKDADARCWQHSMYGAAESWGPFVGTAGALDIAVHARSMGSEFVCVRLPDDTAPCYRSFVEQTPEQTLREVLDLEHVGRTLALGRDGRILDMFGPVGKYGEVELRPTRIATIRGARALIAAPFVAPLCALDERSALRCTHAGQPGPATLLAALRAVPGPLRSIGLTDDHGCVVTGTGMVACAGRNRWGELGSGEPFNELPRRDTVEIPGIDAVREVAVTDEQTCVMTATSVRCFGRNGAVDVHHQHSILALDARRIMSRADRTCIVDSGERTWCWGTGVEGSGPRRVHFPGGAPMAIAGLDGECFVDERRSIVCGVLRPDPDHPGDLRLAHGSKPRTIAAVGRGGEHAEIVHGVLRLRDSSLEDPVLRGPVTEMSSSWNQTCVLAGAGEIRCWTRQRGPWGVRIHQHVPAIADAIGISGRCALHRSGRVSCWSGASLEDTGLAGAQRIVGNDREVCALLPERRLRCASLDPLGLEPPSNPIDENVVDLVAGTGHWCAVLTDGNVTCWGDNQYGQLGTLPVGVSLEGREISWGGP